MPVAQSVSPSVPTRPVEFVVRSLKETGWSGFSVGTALSPLTSMGQELLEPPSVAGWGLGQTWFSTGAMLARMNLLLTSPAVTGYTITRANLINPSLIIPSVRTNAVIPECLCRESTIV